MYGFPSVDKLRPIVGQQLNQIACTSNQILFDFSGTLTGNSYYVRIEDYEIDTSEADTGHFDITDTTITFYRSQLFGGRDTGMYSFSYKVEGPIQPYVYDSLVLTHKSGAKMFRFTGFALPSIRSAIKGGTAFGTRSAIPDYSMRVLGKGFDVFCETAQVGASSVKLYDLHGNLVREDTFDGRQVTLNLSNEPKGVYFAKVTGPDFSKIQRFVLP